jgi:hypothetical protein
VTQSLAGLVASAGQLLGTNTDDNAAAGKVGEMKLIQTNNYTTPIQLTSTTACNAGAATCPSTGGTQSTTLTPGDWSCMAMGAFTAGGTTTVTRYRTAVSDASATMPTLAVIANSGGSGRVIIEQVGSIVMASGDTISNVIPPFQVQVSQATATLPLYLVTQATFTGSTLSTFGSLECRRMR